MEEDSSSMRDVRSNTDSQPAKRAKTDHHGCYKVDAQGGLGKGDDSAAAEDSERIPRPKVDKGKGRAPPSPVLPSPAFLLDSDPEYDEDEDADWNGESGTSDDEEEDEDEVSSLVDEIVSTDAAGAPISEPLPRSFDSDVDDDEYLPDLPLVDADPTAEALVEPFTDDERKHIHEVIRERGFEYFWNTYVTGPQAIPPLRLLHLFGYTLPNYVLQEHEPSNVFLYDLIRRLLVRFLRQRRKLKDVNDVGDVVELLKKCKNIMVLTGAGVSVSCGIPDFRSPNGIYSRLDEFELDDPQQMFDIRFFKERPEVFYSFAREIFPSNFKPSPCHMFVKLLETKGKLLRNYTQNIDTLEVEAGIENVLMCHGSFATASCITCGHRIPGSEIKKEIFAKTVPKCNLCENTPPPKPRDDEDESASHQARSIMKPDIVFFGEALPSGFHDCLPLDREKIDLLIVMGSSLKVAPVSEIMACIPHSIPQVVINRTPITHMVFDVQLLGNADTIVTELCRRLGWDLRHERIPGGSVLSPENVPAEYLMLQPGICLFEGAVLDESGSEESAPEDADDEREVAAGPPSVCYDQDGKAAVAAPAIAVETQDVPRTQ